MKKTILLIAVVLAAGVVSGQKTFTFGPKVGINIADLYASSAENTRDPVSYTHLTLPTT